MKRVKDKKEKLKKVKPKYSLASNLFFIFKQLYKDYGLKVVVAFAAIVASVLLEQVFVDIVPAVAVNAIENQMGVQYFFITVGLAIIGYAITRAVQLRAKEWWNIYGQFTRIFTFIGMMIEKSLKTDYANVESHENQKLIGKANSAISGNWRGIERVYKEFPYVLVNGLGMVLYGGLIVMVDFKILIVLICMLFCNIWFNGYARNFVNRTREENSEVERKLWYLSEGAKDIVAGKDARIYRMEKWFGDLMEAYVEKGVKWQKRVEKHYYLPVLSDTLFIALRDGLAYIILIHLAVSGEISLATFTLMLGVITHFSDWLFAFVGSWNDMIDANVPIGDVRDMLELKDRFKREGGVEIDTSQFPPEIELKDVSFWYDNEDEIILSNINLHIKKGEKIALVGNNGAGKTTLVKLLCGFYEPKEGEILVNGIPLREYNIESYFKMLGIVFQDMDDQGFSMLNTVCCQSDKDADIDRFWKAVEAAGLKSKIESLEKREQTYLSPILDENGIRLSGGEMQKLMLARCIYKDAPFLILDEPTAALDPLAESAMYEEYNSLTENKTSLFISHRLASTRFCDRILFLENGQIAESGSHDELMKRNGRYAKIYDIQSHYYKKDGDIEDMEAAYEG